MNHCRPNSHPQISNPELNELVLDLVSVLPLNTRRSFRFVTLLKCENRALHCCEYYDFAEFEPKQIAAFLDLWNTRGQFESPLSPIPSMRARRELRVLAIGPHVEAEKMIRSRRNSGRVLRSLIPQRLERFDMRGSFGGNDAG